MITYLAALAVLAGIVLGAGLAHFLVRKAVILLWPGDWLTLARRLAHRDPAAKAAPQNDRPQ